MHVTYFLYQLPRGSSRGQCTRAYDKIASPEDRQNALATIDIILSTRINPETQSVFRPRKVRYKPRQVRYEKGNLLTVDGKKRYQKGPEAEADCFVREKTHVERKRPTAGTTRNRLDGPRRFTKNHRISTKSLPECT